MKEFQAAAKQAVAGEGEEEVLLEFGLAGQTFHAKLPTSGQVAMVAGSFDGGSSEMVSSIFSFLRGVLQDDGYRRIRKLISEGTVPFEVLFGGDDQNEFGIVEWISAEAAARPTQRLADSLPSRESTSPPSTGRSRGPGSIPSPSASGSS